MPAVVIAAWGVGYSVSLAILLQTPAGQSVTCGCGGGSDRLWALVPLVVSGALAIGAAYVTARTPRRRAGRG